MDDITITITEPSRCTEHEGAIDAYLEIGDRDCEVTLIPDGYTGELDTWGSLEHWANYPTQQALDDAGDERDEMIGEIVAAVRAAHEAHA